MLKIAAYVIAQPDFTLTYPFASNTLMMLPIEGLTTDSNSSGPHRVVTSRCRLLV